MTGIGIIIVPLPVILCETIAQGVVRSSKGDAMNISIPRASSLGLASFIAVILAVVGMILPTSATAFPPADGKSVLLMTIQRSETPCRLLKGNTFLGPEAVYAGVWANLRRGWQASSPSYGDALGVTGLSIVHYCPQHLPMAPTPDGIAYGPWALIPVNSPEQPLLLAYHHGQRGCNIARSQGVHAAVTALSVPDPNTQAYGGVGVNEAKKGMLAAAATLCADQFGPVRAYLGG